MADTDLAARIAETAAFIEAQLREDESWANVALEVDGTGKWQPGPHFTVADSRQVRLEATDGATAIHAARHDPARALAGVKATRDLVAAIMAERHDWNPEDEFYSCRQAVNPENGPQPGSGCSRDDAGGPCDCGRDARVARLLGIIAGEWGAGG